MTAGALAWAIVAAGLFFASGLVVATTVKRAFFDAWRSGLAVVTVVMIWIIWALIVGQLLGAFGLLRRGPLLLVAVACAGVTVVLGRRLPPRVRQPEAAATSSGGSGQVALIAMTVILVVIVGCIWTARTIIAVHRGINDPDSLSYHIPFAVTFAQTGFANTHFYPFPSQGEQFFPADDELLSAIALVLTHSIVFAVVKNLVLGAFTLVAAYALGKPFRAGVQSLAGAAIVLGLPVIAFSQPGEAVNDSLVLLSVVAALAFLAHAGDRPAPYVLAMACAGIAIGDKFSAIVPALAVGVFVLVWMATKLPTRRLLWAGGGVLATLVTSGSWYLRNAITYGNPIPPAHLGFGPWHLRVIDAPWKQYELSILPFLLHRRDLGVFARGLPQGLGPLVLVVGLLCAVGLVAGLCAREHFRSGLAAVGLISAFGYLVTPGGAWGVNTGSPYIFVINLHYAAPALMFALMSAGIAWARWRGSWLLPVVGSVIVVSGIDAGRKIATWSPAIGGPGLIVLLIASLCGGAALLGLSMSASHRGLSISPSHRRVRAAALLTAVVGALVGWVMIAAHYPRLSTSDPVERWATTVSRVRIAGWVSDVAWLYGPGATNRVVTLTRDDQGAPVAQSSCSAWMRAVKDGHYQFSAVMPATQWYTWLTSDPAFRLVAKNDTAAVFSVIGKPNVDCPATG